MSWKISKVVLIGLLLSVITGYASSYFFKVDTDTSFLIGLVGAVLSLLLELLNNVEKIASKLPKLEILFLLDDIYEIHPALWKRVQKIVREIHSERKIEERESSIQALLSELVSSATIEVLAVHLVKRVEDLTAWNSPQLLEYYRANQKAAKRIRVSRIFILSRNNLISSQFSSLNNAVLEVMQEQKKKYQIDVQVAWDEPLPSNLYEDYVVIDRKILKADSPSDGYSNWMKANKVSSISFSTILSQKYVEKFNELSNYAKPLEEWIQDNKSYLAS